MDNSCGVAFFLLGRDVVWKLTCFHSIRKSHIMGYDVPGRKFYRDRKSWVKNEPGVEWNGT